jgi:subtilisin
MTSPIGEAPINAPRDKQFLVTRKDVLLPADLAPLQLDDVLDQLAKDPTVQVIRTIEPTGLALLADTPTSVQKVIVTRMSDERAQELDQLHPQLLVEEDALVRPVPAPAPMVPDQQDPGSFLPFGGGTTWVIRVTGPDDAPAGGAAVYLYGAGVPAQGRTGDDGTVSLSLLNETDDTVRALFVNPQTGYWDLWIDNPRLSSSERNSIRLRRLDATFTGFPDSQLIGWGQRTMRLDQLDSRLDGAGVKVAVIDSGTATSHPDLGQIKAGRDFTVIPANDTAWTNDIIAHGSHCSGIIAGSSDNATGIRGFAPAADVRELRIFPGGRFSTVLDALDYCIQQQIDVVNMSLGSGGTSDTMLQKLAQVRQSGVACIVAAGNSGDAVQFPGVSPDVLTVAAIGKLGEFPADSFHARQVPADGPIDKGYFSATFSCHGPEVDVCAPGVAVVSSVPPDGFAAWDGTSMATPHITGLAALVLAHHPDLADGFGKGTATRVDRLFEIIKASATPLNLGDPGRTGAGVPDAVRAVTGQSAPTSAIMALLEQLHEQFVAVRLLSS